ncbi:MAG: SDR family oxidoreductase [Dehalococcoidia bacterium]|nr:SDR family oxidoreductase [Dehalococcoidia bacterium]
MPILPEYSLAGRRALLYTAGGDYSPLLAQALAEAGASLLVAARRQELVDAALAGVGTKSPLAPLYERGELPSPPLQGGVGGIFHSGVVSDLTTPAGVAQVMATLDSDDAGPIDILVNDARSFFAKPFAEISLQEWETVQARNARAVFLLCQAVGGRMVQQGYGRIVNLISGLAERGMANAAAFSASQAVVLSLTRSLAVEWGPHNIRVNALGLGWFSADDAPPEVQQQEQLVRYIPLRRRGHPRDIGPLLVYLCSEACDYTTGQPVYVDGGLNARA